MPPLIGDLHRGGIYALLNFRADSTFDCAIFVCSRDDYPHGDCHVITEGLPFGRLYICFKVYHVAKHTRAVTLVRVGQIGDGSPKDLHEIRCLLAALSKRPWDQCDTDDSDGNISLIWWRAAMECMLEDGVLSYDDLGEVEEEVIFQAMDNERDARKGTWTTVVDSARAHLLQT